jgi:LDH2 family malate/lactate/ureidoglycolate dehydrogenase
MATNNTTLGYVDVTITEAINVTTMALQKLGWDKEDAALQADIMTEAELCGNNQGLVKMYQPHLMAPSESYIGKPVIEKETATSAVINANQSPGMLAATMAADIAANKVANAQSPVAVVTAYNTSTSSGQLAYYVKRMVQSTGCIGIAMCNSPEFVAAAPGGKPVFGTNPIAIGIPQQGLSPFTVRSLSIGYSRSLFCVQRFSHLLTVFFQYAHITKV